MNSKTWLIGLALPALASANTMQCTASNFHAEGMFDVTAQWQSPQDEVLVDTCVVKGALNAYTGTDERTYAIGFELRLPKQWTGQFAYQFNGGNDGKVKPALGSLSSLVPQEYAVNRGMAVISSDGGHDASQFKDMGLAGGSGFGFDDMARKRYGYQAVSELYPVANQLIEQFYGRAAEYRYGIGSSNGGRMAMVAASRFPDYFDGLLVGYPGYNLPKAAVQHAWDIQHLHSLNSDLKASLTSAELALVGDAILEQCDNLDGLKDGLIFNGAQCQNIVDLQPLVCGKDERCLSQAKVDALTAMHRGPYDSQGKALYSSWYYDAGIASKNWRFWKVESPIKGWGYNPVIAAMGASSLAVLFTTPPTKIEGTPQAMVEYLLGFDFDKDAPRIFARNAQYTESAMQYMTPPDGQDPTLAEFKASGGKMIIFHGNSDPVFSVQDTVRWYEALNQNQQGQAETFVRFYQVPGMSHGKGGPALDRFDVLTPLQAWVEQGKQPNRIISRAHADNSEVGEKLKNAQRPLCPYPNIAVYQGGKTNAESAFECRSAI
ncbi:MAG: tannase/feruloyl esterase family alpha/beta hydrolase [Pseudomonadota bacterium]|nr:tannase/feruloyl esterase family alpha/beta hydrolase [Pseudomonadota bacterium]